MAKEKNKNKERKDDSFLDDAIKSSSSNTKTNYGIILLLCSLVFISLYFQYKYERSKLEGYNPDDEEQNYYEILDVEYGADIKTIKQAYKKLAIIW